MSRPGHQNEGKAYSTLSGIIFLGIILSGITYTTLALRLLIKHKIKIKDNYSYIEKINLEWLFKLIIGLSCIWIIVFFANEEIIFSSVVLYVLLIGDFGIKQVGIFTNQLPPIISLSLETAEKTKDSGIPAENAKYQKSTLTIALFSSLNSIYAQTLNWNSLDSTKHIIHVGVGWDYSLSYSLGCAYQVNTKIP